MPRYSTEPCHDDCWGDGLHNVHYHEVGGDDMIRKVIDFEQTSGDPDGPEYPRPESGLAPDVLGMKFLVYGLCAAIVLACLAFLVWSFWP